MSRGSMGAAVRRSQSTKATRAATPPRPVARITGDVQPWAGPSVRA